MNDHNDTLDSVGHSTRSKHSIHTNANCRYESVKCNYFNQNVFISVVYVLIRTCLCGLQKNKQHLMDKKIFYIHEFGDGLELHIDSLCCYTQQSEDGGHKLSKLCYCPRDGIANLRAR